MTELSELLMSLAIRDMLDSSEEVSRVSVLSRLNRLMLTEWDENRCYAYVMAIRELQNDLNITLLTDN